VIVRNHAINCTKILDIMAKAIYRVPLSLGIAGLIPFVGTTVGYIWYPSYNIDWIKVQSYYGSSILSFMGAVHWGLAMARPVSFFRYAGSTIPSLIGFFSLLSPNPTVTLSSQLIGFTGVLIADRYAHQLVPKWYLPMRIFLTATVSVCLGSTIITRENRK
jgi:hypothetical protein